MLTPRVCFAIAIALLTQLTKAIKVKDLPKREGLLYKEKFEKKQFLT